MTSLETRRFEMLARVREFGINHPDLFPVGSRPAELLATVGAVVDELSAQDMAQQTGSGLARSGAANRVTVCERVHSSLEAIRRSARELSDEAPGVDKLFRLPRSSRAQAVLSAARTFVANAEPLKPKFERQMLGPEFFAALDADIAAFEQALSAQRRGRDARVAATEAMKAATSRGLKTVRSLDTLMLNRFGKGTTMLATWKSACRIFSAQSRGSAPAAEPAKPVNDAA